MALSVYKYPFAVDDDVVIQMPRGAKVLHVAAQGDQPTLWALVDPAQPMHPYRFLMRGTGHPVPDNVGPHVGSFFHGPFVWHLFQGWLP